MDFKKTVAISSMPGLYQVIKAHANGALVRMLGEERIQLVSSRYNFSLLEAISIYTQDVDSIGLSQVFLNMEELENNGTTPPVGKATDKELASYFASVLPNYDRSRVYMSDVKKVIKWYQILKANNAMPKIESPEEAASKPSDETAQ